MIEKVTANLRDEKLQKQILDNAVAEIERESLSLSPVCLSNAARK